MLAPGVMPLRTPTTVLMPLPAAGMYGLRHVPAMGASILPPRTLHRALQHQQVHLERRTALQHQQVHLERRMTRLWVPTEQNNLGN